MLFIASKFLRASELPNRKKRFSILKGLCINVASKMLASMDLINGLKLKRYEIVTLSPFALKLNPTIQAGHVLGSGY